MGKIFVTMLLTLLLANSLALLGILGYGLGTGRFALQRVEKINDLPQCRSQMFGRCTFDFAFDALKSVFEQIFQIPADTING